MTKNLIEILDEAALKRRPNRNGDWLYQTRPDFGVLPSLEQNTRDTTCHTMVNQPHWQPWFQIVFTTSDFMQDEICSRVGESSCVLLLVYAISFPNKWEGVTSSWLELLQISIATTQEVEETNDIKLPFSVCLECFFQIQDSLSLMCLIHQKTMRTIPKVQKERSSEIEQLAVQVSKLQKSPWVKFHQTYFQGK